MKNTPYPFQQKLLVEIDSLQTSSDKPVVLAASCGAGKTFMSIYQIEKYLKIHPDAKVLVLTHGQVILRSQYHDNLEKEQPDFSYVLIEKSKQLEKKYYKNQVFVALPQTLRNIDIPKFDLVVVDEAHQRYFAKQVEDIIKQAKPVHQLLLTGTPSPFIARNSSTKQEFHILSLPMGELLKEGQITDVLVELAQTTYPITGDDYNQEGNVREDFKFEEVDTNATLDKLLKKIHSRLKSVARNNPKIYSVVGKVLPDWAHTLKALEKTMIACHSQDQARQVATYFKNTGVEVALSISDDDPDAEAVDTFKNNPKCAVLVVVGRGVLGFNFEELVNVVDMTGSQNIDRIFQLMARIVRKHPKGYQKLFFKISSSKMASYFEHLMTGVLCLTSNEWYTKYNGKNFLQLPLPVKQIQREKRERDNKKRGRKPQEIKPIEYVGLPAIRLFDDISHKDHLELAGYSYTTLGKVRAKLLGIVNIDPEGNKKAIIEWIEAHVYEEV